MVSGQSIDQEKVKANKRNIFLRHRLKWSIIIFGLTIIIMGYMSNAFITVMLIGSSGYASYTSWALRKRGFKWAIVPFSISILIFIILMTGFLYGLFLGLIEA